MKPEKCKKHDVVLRKGKHSKYCPICVQRPEDSEERPMKVERRKFMNRYKRKGASGEKAQQNKSKKRKKLKISKRKGRRKRHAKIYKSMGMME